MSGACVRWSLGSARTAMMFAVAAASVLASVSLAPLGRVEATAAVVASVVPQPPGAVTPTREVVTVTASGPTAVTANIAKDAVWGPEGSPYVIDRQILIPAGRALTLLPGTVVKFSGTSARLVADGQLLSLGTAAQPVTMTSIKDDSVGGDTNGDGAATLPARGDWAHVAIASKPFASNDEESNPVSVIDHTNFSYGGYAVAAPCYASALLDVSTPYGRVVVTNSTFREALRAGIKVARGQRMSTVPIEALRACTAIRSRIQSAGSRPGKAISPGTSSRRPWTPRSSGSMPTRARSMCATTSSSPRSSRWVAPGWKLPFNQLTSVGVWGSPSQQNGDYRWNYWGPGSPLASDPLTSAPPEFLPESVLRACHRPTGRSTRVWGR